MVRNGILRKENCSRKSIENNKIRVCLRTGLYFKSIWFTRSAFQHRSWESIPSQYLKKNVIGLISSIADLTILSKQRISNIVGCTIALPLINTCKCIWRLLYNNKTKKSCYFTNILTTYFTHQLFWPTC